MTSMPFHLTRANLNSRRSQLHTTSTQAPTQTTPRSLYSDLISTRSQSITRIKQTMNESKFTTLLAFSHSTKRVSVNYTTETLESSAENTTSVTTVGTSTTHPPNATGLSTGIATDHIQIGTQRTETSTCFAYLYTILVLFCVMCLVMILFACKNKMRQTKCKKADSEMKMITMFDNSDQIVNFTRPTWLRNHSA